MINFIIHTTVAQCDTVDQKNIFDSGINGTQK